MPVAIDTIDAIEKRISHFIETDLRVPADEIDPGANLGSFGMSSVAAVKLVGLLEDEFNKKLSPTMVYDFPTIASLAKAIAAVEPIRRSA
ncbi:MAG: acyl carrier protein [Pseudomonadota bacterium]